MTYTSKKVYQFIKNGESVFSERADRDIERNRKGSFELIFAYKDGTRPKEAKLHARLKQIDFNFGANIFMLGEYDEPEKNKLYEEKFCKIFNSAAIPLYWEGTEPEQGYLRYEKGTKRDVYRRPPADEVRDFCLAHGLRMKGHPLFWHEFVPMWLPDDYRDLKPLVIKRFEEIAERYKDTVECFDVVNEPSRIYDVYLREKRNPARKYLIPEDDYCLWMFDLARKYFPSNKLILNDTMEASFMDFRGKYSGYYLNIKDLLSRGAQIDEIGMQCHVGDWGPEKLYNSEILYDILDTYAQLGKTLNISEIGIPSVFEGELDEDLQALAAERLYKACFSHPSMTGITWWNLPDDGILATKRTAGFENLPSTGLIDENYNEKAAYKTLNKLINEEWSTDAAADISEGLSSFRGFYGEYEITVADGDKKIVKNVKLNKNMPRVQKIIL